MTAETPPSWPDGVVPIRVADLKKIGIDKNRQLFWDGQKIEIRRRLDLTRPQKLIALIVTAAAILGGLGGFLSGLADTDTLFCTHNNHYAICRLLPAD
jgi:hypothetical protein